MMTYQGAAVLIVLQIVFMVLTLLLAYRGDYLLRKLKLAREEMELYKHSSEFWEKESKEWESLLYDFANDTVKKQKEETK